MKWIRPTVYLLAGPDLNEKNVGAWLAQQGVADVNQVFASLSDEPGESLVGLAAKRCYKSFEPGLNPNVRRVRGDHKKHLTNLLEQGHGSVLEHACYTFGIEGVSRVFTEEMNRHRAGMAISEGSMRFISFEELVMVEPPSFRQNPDSSEEEKDDYNFVLNQTVRESVAAMAGAAETHYREAIAKLKALGYDGLDMARRKKLTSALRRGVPMGVATGGVWTGNIRALRHIITMRTDPAAEEEIREVSLLMLEVLRHELPVLFGDFDPTGKPTYRKV